ncbi:MAG: AIM24 family protein, partial [bacterium]
MAVPELMRASTKDETYGGISYRIEGDLVPVLQIELSRIPVYFEHHVLLWKDSSVQVALKPLKGAFKRAAAGMPIMMAMAAGPGRIGFSRDGAGLAFAMHL